MSVSARLWPWEARHVVSSGLRARRVALVHEVALMWRVFYESGSRWRVVRTRLASIDDYRSAGNDKLVAVERSRTKALAAADNDAIALAGRTPEEVRDAT